MFLASLNRYLAVILLVVAFVFFGCQNEANNNSLSPEELERLEDILNGRCYDSNDCDDELICVQKACVAPSETIQCGIDSDCEGELKCVDNNCVGNKPDGCQRDTECGDKQRCVSGECIDVECRLNTHCAGTLLCVDYKCSDPADGCQRDTECGDKQRCMSGDCIDVECRLNTHCAGTLLCVDYKCSAPLTDCPLINGSKATIVQVTDGDTIWVTVRGANCLQKKYNIRIHGIDAPECSKVRNTYYYYECTQDEHYTNVNEPYGYESWLGVKNIIARNQELTISCDKPVSGGWCPLDDTHERYLAYVSLNYAGKTIDLSTEIARQGLAFAHTGFTSSKLAQICAAQFEAFDNNTGLWSLATSFEGVRELMGKAKRAWLGSNEAKCQNAINQSGL
ncbi:MAG: thermonuclease family protein [Bradymonadia bacterium]|jgi:endonuclease YncB( thermonuclease family)